MIKSSIIILQTNGYLIVKLIILLFQMSENEQELSEGPKSPLIYNDPYPNCKQSYNNIIIYQTLANYGD